MKIYDITDMVTRNGKAVDSKERKMQKNGKDSKERKKKESK